MNGEWPTCDARTKFFDDELVLDCVRPKGHEFDGVESHLSSNTDSGVVEWSITFVPGERSSHNTGTEPVT